MPGRAVSASLEALTRRRYDRVKLVQDVSHQIASEMGVTARSLTDAAESCAQDRLREGARGDDQQARRD